MLTTEQKNCFWRDGFVVIENVVNNATVKTLQDVFHGWVEQSREYTAPFGELCDGRPRYDLAASHTANNPALRRVNSPIEVSDVYLQVMLNSNMADCVADLIGPNIKFHHAKINSKLPGSETAVKWHQDFPFTPHSNDDLITALLMVDEVTLENGPLEVVPGSHTGELFTLWHEGKFTGAVNDTVAANCVQEHSICTGPAGSVCFMHTRLLHGSSPNLSNNPRTLFICVYSADDAQPYSRNPVPSKFEGILVRGKKSDRVRTKEFDFELPELPNTASFFDQQS